MPDIPEPASLHALLEACARYMAPPELALLRRAYTVAAQAHLGMLRKSGEPFIEHPLAVARILTELDMDAQCLVAALLHDTVEDTSLTLDQVRERFGPEITEVVDGVTKFDTIEDTVEAANPGVAGNPSERKAGQKAETVRKLLMAMIRDPRVVLLKLADRLHNMRTLAAMPPAKREVISRETLDIYVPLAGRIGLYVFMSELEDLAFLHLDPEAFARTAKRLNDEAAKRASWAQRMCERTQRELAASGITAEVSWRVKRVYRAYLDAQESGMDVALLHDVLAFRVLVDRVSDCYQALGIIHHLWHPYGERIRDYIASPKVNGYQSLHTAVFALDGRLAQMYIRTRAMHRAAQFGVAAYWLERAEAGAGETPAALPWLEHMPAWIKQLANWQQELKLSAKDFVETLRGEVFEDQVFVFTPKGDVREMPAGATMLDLAYRIHTAVGDHAVGARVQASGPDGMLVERGVGFGYRLRTGDIVRVLTDPAARPQPGWLAFVSTRYARERIVRSLRRLEEGGPRDTERAVESLEESAPGRLGPLLHPSGRVASVQLPRCCYPCPGDKIVGLVERGRAVAVHRACCRTLRSAVARRRARGARHAEPVKASWEGLPPLMYRLHLAIYGQDHQGLMHEVSSCVAELGLNVSHSVARSNRARYKAAILLTLDMPPRVRQEHVLRRLRSVPGVIEVERNLSKGCGEANL